MKKILGNVYIYIICIICMILTCVIIFVDEKSNLHTMKSASSCAELVLNVKFKDNTCNINIWQDTTDNIYYFFLPSSDDEFKMSFMNLNKDDSIHIDGKVYKTNDEIDVEYCKKYNSILEIRGEVYEQEIVFMKSENLPSLFINTETGTVDNIHSNKDIKEKASVVLLDEYGTKEYSNSIEYIKTRGNSTFKYYDKKPYQIKLFQEHSLLGMNKAEKWVLLANAVDDSLIRNDIILNYAQQYTSIPTSNGQFIDLYINGNYMGNYYLCEKIEIDKDFLDIEDLGYLNKEINGKEKYNNAQAVLSEDGNVNAYIGLDNPDDITGGYLVEYDISSDVLLPNSFRTESGKCFTIVCPEKATMEQAQYICNLFNEYENAVSQEDGINLSTGKHFSEYMDIDSWASKYIVEECFANPDSTMLSMYFYKDYDSIDSRIYCGPMWDYDRAIGGDCINQFWIDNPEQIDKFGIYVNEMMSHNEVKELVYDKFENQIKPYVEYLMSADIYNLSVNLEDSYAMDKVRWPQNYGYYNEKDSNYDYLIGFMERKVAYLNDVWIEGEVYCTVTFLDENGSVYKSYSVKRGESLGVEPTISNWGGIFNGWYSVDREVIFDARLPVYEDVTYSAKWIDIDLLMENGLAIAEMDISQVDSDVLYYLAELVDEQQNLSQEDGE